MYAESLCGFCQKLPASGQKKTGKESRCPLCKTRLVTIDGGKIYRLTEDDGQDSGTYVKHWWQKLVGV